MAERPQALKHSAPLPSFTTRKIIAILQRQAEFPSGEGTRCAQFIQIKSGSSLGLFFLDSSAMWQERGDRNESGGRHMPGVKTSETGSHSGQ